MALLRSMDESNHNFVRLSGINTVSLGEDLVALGYPLSGMMGNSIKLTTGTLSGTAGLGGDTSKYQISVPIQPGNSGGPIFDSNSNVVGVVVSRLSDSYMLKHKGQLGQNVNFAVKSSILRNFLEVNNVDYSVNTDVKNIDAIGIYKQNKQSVLMIICYQ